jgi:hypothetical protein
MRLPLAQAMKRKGNISEKSWGELHRNSG